MCEHSWPPRPREPAGRSEFGAGARSAPEPGLFGSGEGLLQSQSRGLGERLGQRIGCEPLHRGVLVVGDARLAVEVAGQEADVEVLGLIPVG